MLGRVFGLICVISALFAIVTGNTAALGTAVLDGAQEAIRLTLTMTGAMCLWCGLLRVLEQAGALRVLTRLLTPLLRLCFPTAAKTGNGMQEISASLAANLLGLGNAATPLGIRAMQQLQKDAPPGIAGDDMVTFAVLNTASVSLLPTTLLSLRRAAGSAQPFLILVPVWVCSAAGAVLAVSLCRAAAWRRNRRRGG